MPAAAVIPAPIAYTNVVAVKKLVVGFQNRFFSLHLGQDSFLLCAEGFLTFICKVVQLSLLL